VSGKLLNLLFVYGTLRSEFENEYARLLRQSAEQLGAATVRGSIYRLGDYPGFRSLPQGTVSGELYRLSDPEGTLALLDAYEGQEFQRVIAAASCNGEEVEAWIYGFCFDPPSDARIESGDFSAQ
jgi:gamma-glutamylcyclotransferase (GGCT)/AIG2-like uncharacterized protein YtfP